MGLRCLLGHDFGEPETERERNEEGNEVVVTVREVKTCQRCGEKQVVSENKEIKSIDQLRESATAGRTDAPSGSEPATSEPAGDDGWRTGGSVGGVDEPTSPGESGSSAEQWSTDELEVGSDSTEPEPEEPTADADDADDVDQGVAEIIESAEREDDMLQTDEGEGGADETEADGQQPDASEEDAEILDADGPSEERHEQWDEEADPSQVPGQDQTDVEEDASEGEDAIIMGGDETPVDEDESPDPVETKPTEQADEEPTAVESEDAVILDDDGDSDPAEPTEAGATGDENVEPEDAVPMDESTEETGHTPWPETPGEDEGHDATEPDGEPAEVEFGGGLTPDEPQHEENGTKADASTETEPGQPTAESGADAEESGATKAPEPNINLEQSSREAQLEYYCAECGLTRDVGNSSMRAGDICPDCRKGYITEREKAE